MRANNESITILHSVRLDSERIDFVRLHTLFAWQNCFSSTMAKQKDFPGSRASASLKNKGNKGSNIRRSHDVDGMRFQVRENTRTTNACRISDDHPVITLLVVQSNLKYEWTNNIWIRFTLDFLRLSVFNWFLTTSVVFLEIGKHSQIEGLNVLALRSRVKRLTWRLGYGLCRVRVKEVKDMGIERSKQSVGIVCWIEEKQNQVSCFASVTELY